MTENTTGSLATAAVVVSCNGHALLRNNLPSLQQQSLPFRRILVVDNGSVDDSRRLVDSLPGADLLCFDTNLGFAAANNRGIELALADPGVNVIATINNDVRLAPNWHEEALTALALESSRSPQTVRVGSIATTMLQADHPELIDSEGIVWAANARANNGNHGQRHKPEPARSTTEVWGASAAACLYTRDFLLEVGGFDESFFAYQEDVDLALRGRQAGFCCQLAHRAIGWHLGHGSNQDRRLGGTRADFLNARNRISIMRTARRQGQPAGPMLSSLAGDLLRSLRNRNAPAVWHGVAHGMLRFLSRPPRRTELQIGPNLSVNAGATRSTTPQAAPPIAPNRSNITVLTLTRNEQRNLAGMLESVPSNWPVIVADAGSHDRTKAIASAHGCTVVNQDREEIRRAHGNFDVARNAAARHATTDWLLFLDADERLTPTLVEEIELRITSTCRDFAAFSMPRTNLFWGKPGRLLGEDRQVRLVQRDAGRYQGSRLHQQITVDGTIGQLNNALVHHNVRSTADILRRFRRYVPSQARAYRDPIRLIDVVRRPSALFKYYYIENGARRDGLRGLAISATYAIEHAASLAISWARSQRR